MKKTILIQLLIILTGLVTDAQLTYKDYQRADSAFKFNNLVYNAFIEPTWIDSSNIFWYRVHTREGDQYYLIDAEAQKKEQAFDISKLCKKVNEKTGKQFRLDSLPLRNLTFKNNQKEIEFVIDSTKWNYIIQEDQLTDKGLERSRRRPGYWGESMNELNEHVISPDSVWVAFIKNFNVYIKNRNSGEECHLSYDGSEGDFYSSFFEWSPDSKKLATCKVRDNKKHIIYFVESSPADQLQPKLHQREYLKPGDALPIRRPFLFDIESKKQIPVDGSAFENQFSLDNLKWWKDSRAYTFEFNQRGHQVYQVVEVDA